MCDQSQTPGEDAHTCWSSHEVVWLWFSVQISSIINQSCRPLGLSCWPLAALPNGAWRCSPAEVRRDQQAGAAPTASMAWSVRCACRVVAILVAIAIPAAFLGPLYATFGDITASVAPPTNVEVDLTWVRNGFGMPVSPYFSVDNISFTVAVTIHNKMTVGLETKSVVAVADYSGTIPMRGEHEGTVCNSGGKGGELSSICGVGANRSAPFHLRSVTFTDLVVAADSEGVRT